MSSGFLFFYDKILRTLFAVNVIIKLYPTSEKSISCVHHTFLHVVIIDKPKKKTQTHIISCVAGDALFSTDLIKPSYEEISSWPIIPHCFRSQQTPFHFR